MKEPRGTSQVMALAALASAMAGGAAALLTSRRFAGEALLLRHAADWWVSVGVTAADGLLLALGVGAGVWVALQVGSLTDARRPHGLAAMASASVATLMFPATFLVVVALPRSEVTLVWVLAGVPAILAAFVGLGLRLVARQWSVVGVLLVGLCLWPCAVAGFGFFPIWYGLVGAFAGHAIATAGVENGPHTAGAELAVAPDAAHT